MHPIIFNQLEMQCQPPSCASQFQFVPHIIKSAVKSTKEANKDMDYVIAWLYSQSPLGLVLAWHLV